MTNESNGKPVDAMDRISSHAGTVDGGSDAWPLSGEARIDAQLSAVARTPQGLQALRDADELAARAARWRRFRRCLGGDLVPQPAALMIVVTTALIAWSHFSNDRNVATSLGEQRTVVLRDGSVVRLNTDSAISIDFTKDQRQVLLHHGQATFEVKSDPARPFVALAGDGMVRALGTAFDIYHQRNGRVVVTLLEGLAEVRRRADPPVEATPAQTAPSTPPSQAPALATPDSLAEPATPAVATLRAGEQVAVEEGGGISEIEQVDVKAVTAWQEGKISLSGARLRDAVAEINRYSRTKIELVGGDSRTMRVGGFFHAGDPDAFVRGVVVTFGCRETRPSADRIKLDCSASGPPQPPSTSEP